MRCLKPCHNVCFMQGNVTATDSAVILDYVPYGAAGPFAITLWAKPGGLFGSNYEYLYSHNQSNPTLHTEQPNQV